MSLSAPPTRNPLPWSLGNTTVRNPLRLLGGLKVLTNLALPVISKTDELTYAQQLVLAGVTSIGESPDMASSGRKWRNAFTRLGLIYPSPRRLQLLGKDSALGYTLTPNGLAFRKSAHLADQRESLLRAMLGYTFPELTAHPNPENIFYPLRFIIDVFLAMRELEGVTAATLSKHELATFLLSCDDHQQAPDLAEHILTFRHQTRDLPYRARHDLMASALASTAASLGISSGSLLDYADTNQRYLLATPLFLRTRSSITPAPYQWPTLALLAATPTPPTPAEALDQLWNGTPLPTDKVEGVRAEIQALADYLQTNHHDPDLPEDYRVMAIPDLKPHLHRLQAEVAVLSEARFAADQPTATPEIAALLAELAKTRGQDIAPGERAATLEWAAWRSLLALGGALSTPAEARNFEIDPLTCEPYKTAPGGQPDISCRYPDYTLVVEVTTLTGSTQESREGESVRRHVAATETKPVYGLFLAPTVDSNTAETFRRSTFYMPGDVPTEPQVVPLTIDQYKDLFVSLRTNFPTTAPKALRAVLDNCLALPAPSGPAWKQAIGQYLEDFQTQHQSRRPRSRRPRTTPATSVRSL